MLVFVLTEVDLITVKSPFSCSKGKHILYTINVRIKSLLKLLFTSYMDVSFSVHSYHFSWLKKIAVTGTLDYKALLLLLQRDNDLDFVLGGKGYGEFCAFCDAARVSAHSKLNYFVFHFKIGLQFPVWHLPSCVARIFFLICCQILSVFQNFYFLGVHMETLCNHLIFCT